MTGYEIDVYREGAEEDVELTEFKDEQRKYNVLSYGNNHKLSTVYTLYLCDSKEVQDTILSRPHPDRVDAFFEGIINDLIIKKI